jgi:ubiquinone/menaquinone biosynthesis C-methylase UbiE
MDFMNEIENEWILETGNDFSFMTKHDIFKTEITSLILFYDNCKYDIEQTITLFLNEYLKKPDIYNSIYPYLKEFLTFYESKVFGNAECIDFINKSAHVYLSKYRGNPEIEKYKPDELYKYSKPGTKFVDLACGFNFIHFLDELDKETTYYLVDKSIFTCECIKIKIEEKALSNVFVINKDIIDVDVKDIGDKISVIRVNNIWPYINNFHEYVPKFKEFLMKNGVFVFQEYSKNKVLSFTNNPYTWLDSCFGEGWEKEFIIQNTENIRAFDTFIYRKL